MFLLILIPWACFKLQGAFQGKAMNFLLALKLEGALKAFHVSEVIAWFLKI